MFLLIEEAFHYLLLLDPPYQASSPAHTPVSYPSLMRHCGGPPGRHMQYQYSVWSSISNPCRPVNVKNWPHGKYSRLTVYMSPLDCGVPSAGRRVYSIISLLLSTKPSKGDADLKECFKDVAFAKCNLNAETYMVVTDDQLRCWRHEWAAASGRSMLGSQGGFVESITKLE